MRRERDKNFDFDSQLEKVYKVKKAAEQSILEKTDMTAEEVFEGTPLIDARDDRGDNIEKTSPLGPNEGDDGVHIDIYLQNFSVEQIQSQDRFRTSEIVPSLPVDKRTGKYLRIDVDDFLDATMQEREDMSFGMSDGWKFSSSEYSCKWKYANKPIGTLIRNEADAGIDIDRLTVKKLTMSILMDRENLFKETAMPDISAASDSANPWNDSNTSGTHIFSNDSAAYSGDLIEDFLEAKLQVEEKSGGFTPNVLTITPEIRTALSTNEAILDRINQGSTAVTPGLVADEHIAAALEVDTLQVLRAVTNDARKGASAADKAAGRKFMFKNTALLWYRNPMLSTDDVNAVTMWNWNVMGMPVFGSGISSFYDRKERADIVEADQFIGMNVTCPDLGYYWFKAHNA